MDAAVLTISRRDRRVQLLGVDGSWREVRLAERYGWTILSPDGTRLASLFRDRIELWHLPTGGHTKMALPARFRPWDFARIRWLDQETLLLDDRASGWRVNIVSGSAVRTPYPRRFSWTVDSGGTVLETTAPGRPAAVIDWADGVPRRIDLKELGTLVQVRASRELVAGTAYDDGPFVAFAVDRDHPKVVRTLSMRDFEGNYSNWALRTVHVLGDGSVLWWVAALARGGPGGWRLVRWEPTTNRLEIVTTSNADATWSTSFASRLLESEPPPDVGASGRFDPRDVETRTLGTLPSWSVAADRLG